MGTSWAACWLGSAESREGVIPPGRELIRFVRGGSASGCLWKEALQTRPQRSRCHAGLPQTLLECSLQGTRPVLPGAGPRHPLRYPGPVLMRQFLAEEPSHGGPIPSVFRGNTGAAALWGRGAPGPRRARARAGFASAVLRAAAFVWVFARGFERGVPCSQSCSLRSRSRGGVRNRPAVRVTPGAVMPRCPRLRDSPPGVTNSSMG